MEPERNKKMKSAHPYCYAGAVGYISCINYLFTYSISSTAHLCVSYLYEQLLNAHSYLPSPAYEYLQRPWDA